MNGARSFLSIPSLCAIWSALSTASLAADMTPTRKAAPEYAIYNWSGLYGGVNVGAAFGAYDPVTATYPGALFGPRTSSAVSALGEQNINPLGFAGGFQLGYNWQSGHFVMGVEGDFDYVHLNGSSNRSAGYPVVSNSQFLLSTYANTNWLTTIRPRIGYAENNWLFYATD
jgi:outer membrane immunogenic protein